MNGCNGTVLVRLRAVAMERDDNSEGWVPIGAGGLSNVCIVKRPVQGPPILTCIPDAPTATSVSSLPGAPAGSCPERSINNTTMNNGRYEFIIYANRLIDDELVFRCVVCKDFEYNKVMPTFHNWYNGGKRVGLIFQTAADGRVFDRGIMGALVELSAGIDLLPTSVGHECDNDVFMSIELPYRIDNNKKKPEVNSRHVSPTSTDSSSLRGTPPVSVSESELKSYRQKPMNTPNEQNSLYQPAPHIKQHHHKTIKLPDSGKGRTIGYPPPSPVSPPPPTLSSGPPPLDSPVMYKKKIADHELKFSSKGEKPQRLTCKHCRKRYTPEENVRGSCEYAPDYVRTSIDTVSCIPCARTVVYHCMADSEGNFAQPCECDTADSGCTRRWVGLTFLSILLPCLWCYPVLKVCHLCGVSCGACGGKHEPLNSPSTTTS